MGRNGRNIKAFEQAAGVDVIVDDTPEAVTISCFDSVRREIARRALARLTVDGRIHPAHIEKILEEERKAVDRVIAEAGDQAAFEAGITGLHPEVLRMMGRLKFRTSYGQNQLAHAVEVSKLAGILAAELGANIEISKQGGFLHDIGKAMDHNQDGTHAKLGAEYCKRYGVNPIVVNAIEFHHHEVDQSASRPSSPNRPTPSRRAPGARREDLEAYIKRIRTLEDLSHVLRRRGTGLRHPGWPRGARHRQAGEHRRPGLCPIGTGYRQEDRREHAVPGPDQGDRHPRNPRHGVRQVGPKRTLPVQS